MSHRRRHYEFFCRICHTGGATINSPAGYVTLGEEWEREREGGGGWMEAGRGENGREVEEDGWKEAGKENGREGGREKHTPVWITFLVCDYCVQPGYNR